MNMQTWLNNLPALSEAQTYILGTLVVIFRIADGIKYRMQSQKIRRIKSAKSQSRLFINLAIGSDIILILWVMFKVKDVVLFLTGVLALFCVIELFFVTYRYYNYKTYPKTVTLTLKRPNILTYFWNSLLPNRKRPHL